MIFLDDKLRIEIDKANSGKYPNLELAEVLERMRATLFEGASKETQDALNAINKQYGKFKTVERAAGSLSGMKMGEELAGGFFGGDELANAVKAIGGGRTSYGAAPLQIPMKAAQETIARRDPMPWMDYMRGISRNVHIPGTGPLFNLGADLTMGRTFPQRGGRALAQALRNMGITSGTLGTAGIFE